MSKFTYRVKGVLIHNKDGSSLTQNKRFHTLELCGRQLYEAGFKIESPQNLKPKHVEALLARWKAEGLQTSTIKDRLAQVRWLLEKVGKGSMLPKANAALGIPNRVYTDNIDKATRLTDPAFQKKTENISDARIKLQVELAGRFGLRFEEAVKFHPHEADKGDHILVHYGTKGSQDRTVPISSPEQRAILDRCKTEVKTTASLIPKIYTYIGWQNKAYRQFKKIGLTKTQMDRSFHGLRHGYAQDFYLRHTGWDSCPVNHSSPKEWENHICEKYGLTREEFKNKDSEGRRATSEVMGHHREDIIGQYIGGK